MPDFPPLFPSLQYFLNQIRGRLTGSLGQPSVLDKMNPQQVARLSPEARRILARTPAVEGPPTAGAIANYSKTNYPLLSNLDTGQITTSKNIQAPSLTYESTPEMTANAVLHEGIHAFDYNTNAAESEAWRKALSQLSPESRAELLRRGNWGKGSTTGMNNHITDPHEAMAYAGMYGYENVPEELKPFFNKILNPVQGPPEPNPSQGARRDFDKNRVLAKGYGVAKPAKNLIAK